MEDNDLVIISIEVLFETIKMGGLARDGSREWKERGNRTLVSWLRLSHWRWNESQRRCLKVER